LAVVIYVLGRVAYAAYKFFGRPGKDLKQYGSWAVVTGATDGIGKAYCFELAKQGLNILLISRTQEKLDTVAMELSQHKTQVSTLAIDFTTFFCGSESYNKVAAKLRGLDVGVLINNVGMSYPYPKHFGNGEVTDELINKLIAANIQSTTWMTRLVLPGMQERKRGAIVNISSASARGPCPLLTVYSATKAYVDRFSTSLNAENKHVSVQVQSPFFVTTKLAKIRNPSITTPTPKAYARVGIKAIGYDADISPYWAHAVLVEIMGWLSPFLVAKVVSVMHKGLNKRGLNKDARKAREASS